MKNLVLTLGLILGLLTNSASAQVAGDRVLAVWEPDGYWYPGEIDRVDRQGIHIAFDDGDDAVVGRNEVRRIDWRVGSRLECNWKNEGKYYGGRVNSIRGESMDFLYDDGYREQISISRCRSH